MHPDLEKLVSAGKLPAPAAERLSRLEPGAYCLHGSWGPGRIASWDLGGDRLAIDFEGKAGHEMKLEFAAKSLEPLTEGHVLARRVADRAALAEMAAKNAAGFVRLVLESFGGSMSLDRFEDVVKPKIVPEAKFKSWWESTKRALRSDKSFVIPPKRNLPLELRAAHLSHAEALVADFMSAKDLKVKVKAAALIADELAAFSDPANELKEVVLGLEDSAIKALRLQPPAAFELLLVRDGIRQAVPALNDVKGDWFSIAGALSQERKALAEVLKALPIARTKQLLQFLPEAFGDQWLQEAFARFNDASGRVVQEIARLINDQRQTEEFTVMLQTNLQNRTLSGDVLQWICRERKGDSFEVFDSDFAPALINALEREHYEESNRRSGRLRDLVVADKDLLADLAAQLDLSQVKTFARRLWSSPVFDDLTRRSLVARLIKVHSEVQDIIEHPEDTGDSADDVLVVSHWSHQERAKAFERLLKEEIPQNTKDIQIARSYGDLRENFEFKSAKEQQRVLMRRQKTMEREMDKARPTDFKEAPTHVVSIGTVVEIEDITSGRTEKVSVLGAWDTDPDKGIVSYLSGLGKRLVGRAPGETTDVPTPDGGHRTIRIVTIRRFAE